MTGPKVVEQRRLKYAATINDEVLAEDTDPEYELQYVDIGDVDSSGNVNERVRYQFADAPTRARRLVRDGDVIISTVRTYLQAIAAIEAPPANLVVSTGFAVVRPRPEILDAGFCKYALREPGFLAEVVMRSVGVGYPAINPSDLGDIRIYWPLPQLQEAIAIHLDQETARLDRLVAVKEHALQLVSDKRRTLISRAVTRGLDQSSAVRDSGIPRLGEIPAHWSLASLRRLLTNVDYGTSEVVKSSGKVAVLRMGDLRDGEIDFSSAGFVDEIDGEMLLQNHDLLFNRTNSLDQIGKVAIFRGNTKYPVSFASYLVRLRCKPSVSPEYLNFFLNSDYAMAWARAEALPAIGQANLNPNRYSYLPVCIPPRAEQESIIARINSVGSRLDALRTATERTIALLKERRAALIADAVAGRLPIAVPA